MKRLRFGTFYRLRDKRDVLDYQVSFDAGKSWRGLEHLTGPGYGPTQHGTQWTTVSDVPAGTREARVRFAMESVNTTMILVMRLDADFEEPRGGFAPVKISYTWEENGQEKRDVHVARGPEETYHITCAGKPLMKSITLERPE